MLFEFRIRNFRSVAEEQTFSMLPAKGATHVHRTESKYHPEALKVAAIYGPNGSGKSNLVRALGYLQRLVRESGNFNSDDATGAEPHVLDDSLVTQPSLLEITFGHGEQVWRYGFEATDKQIIAEWLFSRPYETSRERRIFERAAPSAEASASEFHLCRELTSYRSILADRTNANQLFLSKLDQFAARETQDAYIWIVSGLRVVDSVSDFPKSITAKWCNSETQRRTVVEFLRATDVQIDDIVVEESRHNVKGSTGFLPFMPPEMEVEPILSFEKDIVTSYNVKFERPSRSNRPTHFPFHHESLGTRNLFSLAGPIMQSLDYGFCLVIDEMNQSFHPELLRFVVDLFYSQELNENGAQLVMTTHDVSIMDVLERDQIWLCQKGTDGATDVYGLSDFGSVREGGVRRKVAFAKQYLENRFGGLPNLNKLALLQAVQRYRKEKDAEEAEEVAS